MYAECGVWDLKHRSKMVVFEAQKRGSVNENKEESEQKRGGGANPVVARSTWYATQAPSNTYRHCLCVDACV